MGPCLSVVLVCSELCCSLVSLVWIFPAAAIVIPCLSAVVSGYGEYHTSDLCIDLAQIIQS